MITCLSDILEFVTGASVGDRIRERTGSVESREEPEAMGRRRTIDGGLVRGSEVETGVEESREHTVPVGKRRDAESPDRAADSRPDPIEVAAGREPREE